ncbi:MAG TPA: molybdopterin-binding protein [Desulfobacteraceae bacterium]|nr:molybdopterin-binding protein [Desulfobacteraceae bacterium]
MIDKIRIEEAVGTILAHDMTRIVRGRFKGPAFKKGHVVREEDLPVLRSMGKRFVHTLSLAGGLLHEDDAALRIAGAVSGDGLTVTAPSEGKVNLTADSEGLLKVDTKGLAAVNRMDDIILATLKNNFPCHKGQVVAATRIIPLTIPEDRIIDLEKQAGATGPIVSVRPFSPMKVGAVVTGSEVYEGLITDDFSPSVGRKILDAGCTLAKKIPVPDDARAISEAIVTLKSSGCQLIITTGGLSVDPDDVTPQGVAQAGADIRFYGTPVLPGAMLMVSDLDGVPVVSLPACVFYYKRTVFDLILPRILAGETITGNDMAVLGHGGLCMNCPTCHFPACSFGR